MCVLACGSVLASVPALLVVVIQQRLRIQRLKRPTNLNDENQLPLHPSTYGPRRKSAH
jgi:hypothetical protein